MALWEIKSAPVTTHDFVNVDPVEVLVEYDGPLTFTFLDKNGGLILANLCAIGVSDSRYLACVTTNQIIDDMKQSRISMRTALTINPPWIIDVSPTGDISRAWRLDLADLPYGAIPDADAMLYP